MSSWDVEKLGQSIMCSPGDCKPSVFRIVICSNSAQLERPSGLASPGLHNKNVLDRTWVKTFMFSQLEKASLWRCVICFSVTMVTRSSSRVGRLISFMVSIYRGGIDLVGRLYSWHLEWQSWVLSG